MKTTDVTLDSIAKVLIRCFWIGFALLTVSAALFLAAGGLGYEFHKDLWTGLTRHEYDLIMLCALAWFKMVIFVAFLLPYIAIRMVLRQHSEADATAT